MGWDGVFCDWVWLVVGFLDFKWRRWLSILECDEGYGRCYWSLLIRWCYEWWWYGL